MTFTALQYDVYRGCASAYHKEFSLVGYDEFRRRKILGLTDKQVAKERFQLTQHEGKMRTVVIKDLQRNEIFLGKYPGSTKLSSVIDHLKQLSQLEEAGKESIVMIYSPLKLLLIQRIKNIGNRGGITKISIHF